MTRSFRSWITDLSDDDLIIALEASEARLAALNGEWLRRHPIDTGGVLAASQRLTIGRKAFLTKLFFWGLSIPYVLTLVTCAVLLVVL
jgi:hypothetical protein